MSEYRSLSISPMSSLLHVSHFTLPVQSLPNFISPSAFHILVRREVEQLGDPSHTLIRDVRAYLGAVTDVIVASVYAQFPKLAASVRGTLHSMLDACERQSTERLREVLDEEAGDAFTMNHYYMDTFNKVRQGRQSKEGFVSSGMTADDLDTAVSKPITPQQTNTTAAAFTPVDLTSMVKIVASRHKDHTQPGAVYDNHSGNYYYPQQVLYTPPAPAAASLPKVREGVEVAHYAMFTPVRFAHVLAQHETPHFIPPGAFPPPAGRLRGQ